MQRVEVTHVSPTAFGAAGIWGGGERYPLSLAQAMSEHVPTRLIVFGRRAARRRVGRLEICELPIRARWKASDMNPLSERLALYLPLTRRLHVHQYYSVTTNLLLLGARAAGRQVFITDHGGAGRNYADRFRLERHVTGFLPVSAFSATFFPQLADRVSEPLLGGADLERFTPGPEIGRRGREVVFVGRLLPHKGIDVLLRAVDRSTPVRLYGRAYDPGYRRHLESLAAGKDVTFNDGASDDEIAAAYRSARVAVLPSVYRTYEGVEHPFAELLGLALIEAMASGTPVIASRLGGMPEVVRDGETGFLFEPSDVAGLRERLDAVLGDDARWSAMSRAAAGHARSELSWDGVARRALAAYERFGGR